LLWQHHKDITSFVIVKLPAGKAAKAVSLFMYLFPSQLLTRFQSELFVLSISSFLLLSQIMEKCEKDII